MIELDRIITVMEIVLKNDKNYSNKCYDRTTVA